MSKFSIDEYRNLVALLKQALLFYADKKNYTEGMYKTILEKPVLIDNGSQAQFALDKITELEEMYSNTLKEYKNISEDELSVLNNLKSLVGENENDSWEDFLEKVDVFKNIANSETINELKKKNN